MWTSTNPKTGEREVLDAVFEVDADADGALDGVVLVSDKGLAGNARTFEVSPS